MLKILKACLPPPSFDLVTCSDAMSAMSMFKAGRFDIIILDIVMPVIDGFELHSLIRNVNAEIPVIMLTARVDDLSGTMLKKLSSDKNTYYQNKGFKKDELVMRITNIIARLKAENDKRSYFEELEKDIALAGEVQHSMFPHWASKLNDIRYYYYYRPYMKITGDIFTFSQIGKNLYLALIGDISGHGIQAALCMSAIEFSLASMIRAVKSEDITPEEVLNHLQNFISNIGSDRYLTCIAAVIDFDKNKILYQSAGHPDLIIFSPSAGEAIRANPENKGSMPVGLVRGNVYTSDENVEAEFPEDSIIFGYSDGLTDIENKVGNTYTTNPLEEFVSTFAKHGLEASTNFRIIDALFKLGFDEVRDDISLASITKEKAKGGSYDFAVKPMLGEVDKFAQKIAHLIIEKRGDETLAAKVEILVSEFLNNVVVHGLGNKNMPRPVISAHIEFRTDDILLTFCDKGKRWDMQANLTDADSISDLLNYTRATSGRGLSLIKKITSSICRSRYADVLNETSFTVKYQ